MIGITTETYDISGAHVFRRADVDEVLNDSGARRCSRTSTLDGGCEVYDTGYTDSDRTVTVREKDAPESVVDYAKYIVQNYRTIIIAMRDGVFRGVPESWNCSRGVLDFKILIKEKIS